MNRTTHYFLLVFLFCVSTGHTQNSAKLHGMISDTHVKSINYKNYSPFRWGVFNPDVFIPVPVTNNCFDLQLNITAPQLKVICPQGYSQWQMIYVTPGDSVSFSVLQVGENEFNYIFSGHNAGNYNYSVYQQKNNLIKKEPYYSAIGNLTEYKVQLKSWRDSKIRNFREFQKTNEVSKDFVEYGLADIENEYVMKLYYPIKDKLVAFDSIPSDYLSDTKIIENETSHYYLQAIAYKYIYCFTANPLANLDSVHQNILMNTSGQTREYLLSAMIGFYAENQKKDYHDALQTILHDIPKYVKNPVYLDYIRKGEEYFMILNQPFPAEVLTGTLIKSMETNKIISLKSLLTNYEGKLIYVDFWASWCSACRIDISSSDSAKKFLKEKNVEYIYLSRDEDEKKWSVASKEEKIIQNQYLIFDFKNSPLLKFLKVNFIPRYLVLDSEHNIVDANAPRPNPEHLDQLKQCIMKYTGEKKTVTFFN